jgi:iron complex outermembrane receptor protein
VQADLSIRGSTFEQVLVLIDGMRVQDPQTAHHNMDLPLTLADIDYIEILHGQGSSVFGADAFAGAVNIVTKKPKKDSLSLKLKLSDYATRTASVTAEKKLGIFSQRFSVEKSVSNGARYDTDFDNFIFTTKSGFFYSGGNIDLNLGFMDKEFGAYDFYTPGKNYPSREWTSTYFANLSLVQKINTSLFSAKIFHRRHTDKFVLVQTDPALYQNNHRSYIRGGETKIKIPFSAAGSLTLASDFTQDEIKSSNLGNHIQNKYGGCANVQIAVLGNLLLDTSTRAEFINDKSYILPSLAFNLWLLDFWKVRSSVGKVIRTPTYTELYYTDPVNTGNPNLKPEEAVSYELGTDFLNIKNSSFSATFFYRRQKNLIDWTGATATGPWFLQNIGEFNTYGLETVLKTDIYGFKLDLQYSYIESDKNKNYFSKYGLGYKSSQICAGISKNLFRRMALNVKALHRNKERLKAYTLVNARLTKKFTKDFEIFAEATNILNIYYEEIAGIPLPGRWLAFGINWQLI